MTRVHHRRLLTSVFLTALLPVMPALGQCNDEVLRAPSGKPDYAWARETALAALAAD